MHQLPPATEKPRPFSLPERYDQPLVDAAMKILRLPVQKLLGLDSLNEIYAVIHDPTDIHRFHQRALDALKVRTDVTQEDLAAIPADGPTVVVANHPFGAIEGLMLVSLLRARRPDVRVLANHFLTRIPELRSYLIAVDPYAGEGAVQRNIRAIRKAIDWLKRGGLLGIFPAGDVSRLHLTTGLVADNEWNPMIARIVRRTGATVLPIFFEGANSVLFQAAGLIHSRLRTALLPNELLNKADRTISVRIGSPIGQKQTASISDDRDLINYLRLRTYFLAERPTAAPPKRPRHGFARKRVVEPIALASSPKRMSEEVTSLPQEARLCDGGDCSVLCCSATDIPYIMREIGRLRELTFRRVGEGTNHARDIDRFDDTYHQLFIWKHGTREIIGAYRLGLIDSIVESQGINGLYSHTLFRYNHNLIRQIGPAIELGRSFIRPEYQREYAPLHLLWRGIGQFIVHHPHYRSLIGPVSISSHYKTASMLLMMRFLKDNNFNQDLARMVKARTPLKARPSPLWSRQLDSHVVRSIDDVADLIADIEDSQRGTPVLLRQYLRLGGRLLAFNVDPDFNDALDGLILVDLMCTPARVLEKYLGKEGVMSFRAFHSSERSGTHSLGSAISR